MTNRSVTAAQVGPAPLARSAALFERAQQSFAGGVASSGKFVYPQPIYAARAQGAEFTDVDGNRYVDLLMAVGVNILGHSHPAIIDALRAQLDSLLFPRMATENEIELAELVRGCMPHIERIRFATSGSEAAMMALRVARAWTGRRRIAKFEGNVHGLTDNLSFSGHRKHAGPRDKPLPLIDSAGLLPELADSVLVLPYNDLDRTADLIKQHRDELAAVIVEPIAGYGMGAIPARREFLEGLRALTAEFGIVLIWDEIVTGFRVGLGGMSDIIGHTPDLVLLGKVMGGGLPVAAFGGRSDIMEAVLGIESEPSRRIVHAGTFVGHPLAMAAGIAVITELKRTDPYPYLAEIGDQLRTSLSRSAGAAGVDIQVTGIGSFFQIHFLERPIEDVRDAVDADQRAQIQFIHHLLESGVYLLPNHPGFLSTAHGESELSLITSVAEAGFAVVAANREQNPA